MGLNSVNLKHHLTALAVSVLLSGTAPAAPASDDQLDRLRNATEAEAGRIVSEIELQWSKSGSASMDLLLQQGRDAIEEGEFSLAIEHLTALTDHAPRFAEGFHARAEAYFRADLFGPAFDDLQTTLEIDPTHFDAIFGLGVLFQQTGDSRRAAELFRRVLVMHPNHENADQALERLKREGIGREL